MHINCKRESKIVKTKEYLTHDEEMGATDFMAQSETRKSRNAIFAVIFRARVKRENTKSTKSKGREVGVTDAVF